MAQYSTHIIFALLGAIFSAILGAVWLEIRNVLKNKARYRAVLHSQIDALLGNWYSYHFTTEQGKVVFREQEWTFELRSNGYIGITTRDKERPNLVYIGKVLEITDMSVICDMKGKHHKEQYHIRIKYPIPNAPGLTDAIKMGVDFDNQLYTTIHMFSRARLEMTVAEKETLNKLRNCNSEYFFRLVN